MNRQHILYLIYFLLLMISSSCQNSYNSAMKEDVNSEFMNILGQLQTKSVKNISSTPISIGAETLDRDYANYDNYKGYLDTLGTKKIRLQAGWAKTEKVKGEYDWEWLDNIINDAVDRGLQPWLQTSYGNPLYEGGGGPNLAGGFPTSPEAKQAWDNWVDTMAARYKDKVKIWEIWNESDPKGANNPPEDYLELYLRTVGIIKKHIPDARFYALSLAHPYETEYTKVFLDGLKELNKLNWVNDITFHGYVYNPSDAYEKLDPLKKLVESYDAGILMHQGEQGCPSTNIGSGALKNYPWTETSQAKWALRRLLGDLGHGYQTMYFTIADLNYGNNTTTHIKNQNTKGLLKADKANNIERAKLSYFAVQNLCAVMDSSYRFIEKVPYKTSVDSTYSVYGFKQEQTNKNILTLWFDGEIPSDTTGFKEIDVSFDGVDFQDPVYVDLMDGKVYEIPASSWSEEDGRTSFRRIRLSDYPILLAERDLIDINVIKN